MFDRFRSKKREQQQERTRPDFCLPPFLFLVRAQATLTNRRVNPSAVEWTRPSVRTKKGRKEEATAFVVVRRPSSSVVCRSLLHWLKRRLCNREKQPKGRRN